MARVAVLKEALLLCAKARVTPFVWGHRGMGKSSVVMQVAAENNMGFVDMRCSQMEASDLRGLPDRDTAAGTTIFLPSAEMPRGDMTHEQILAALLAPFQKNGEYPIAFVSSDPTKQHAELMELVGTDDSTSETDLQIRRIYEKALKLLQPRFPRGIIFLDELNRSQDDVQQAAFQFVLDREIGQYKLPPGWAVVVAGNYNEGYQVSGFNDPAFLDRFCHLMFSGGDATLEDWIFYMSSMHHEEASEVVEFASQNIKHLDGEIEGDLGFTIQPSRRSWEAVVRVMKAKRAHGFSEDAMQEVLAGLVGRELSLSFSRYNCPVKPRDLVQRGVKPFHTQLEKLNRGQLTGLMWGLVACTKDKVEEDATSTLCLDFAEWMVTHQKDKDLAVAFCRAMVTSNAGAGQEKASAAVISNPRLAKMIGKFNVKHGGRRTFIDRLNERPRLQQVMANVAWGTPGAMDKD